MTHHELKARLMRELDDKVDKLLESRVAGKRLTLTEIEDVVLEVRQRLGQKMAERLIEAQAQELEDRIATPISPATGKRLERKGQKTQPSRHG